MFLLLPGLYPAVLFLENRRHAAYKRLSLCKTKGQILLPRALSGLLLGWISGGLALAALAFWQGSWAQLPERLVLLLFYMANLASLSMGLGILLRGPEPLLASLPFLMVAMFLLCPVLLDVSVFLPWLQPLCRVLPPSLFLRGGAWGALGLCLEAALFSAVMLLDSGRKRASYS